jgi:hypothetical protein
MSKKGTTHLIVNSPYDEPKHHWHYHRETQTFSLKAGRRRAGYVIASECSKAFDEPGRFVPIDLGNQIHPRVQAWREGGYAGVSGITRRLMEHWRGSERYERQRLFFCQFEGMETLIWLTEAPAAERVGLTVPTDGGAFERLCCKTATGSGKTVVMAMLCILDSTWEAQGAYELDHHQSVAAWAKNDHLFFEIAYIFAGTFHKFRPDYLVRLTNGTHLVLETKGEDTPKDAAKRGSMDEWVRAVNAHGAFGNWAFKACFKPDDLPTAIAETVDG